VRLAEDVSGAVPRGANPAYIGGDAITEWEAVAPVARIVNLETSVTRSV
jgi:poly-gamma-glutamate synthesis protein (capsule biosynthesis protein)